MRTRTMLVGLTLLIMGMVNQCHITPADAAESRPTHTPNASALWVCGATRQNEEQTVQHAHPAAMGVYASGVGYLRATCVAQAEDLLCFWVGEGRTNGIYFVYSGPNCTLVG